MRRIEKYGSCLIKTFTMPLRALVGLYNSIERNMPDTLEMPYEIKKRKEELMSEQKTKPALKDRVSEKMGMAAWMHELYYQNATMFNE